MPFRGSMNIKRENLLEMYILSNKLLYALSNRLHLWLYYYGYVSQCEISHGILGPSI